VACHCFVLWGRRFACPAPRAHSQAESSNSATSSPGKVGQAIRLPCPRSLASRILKLRRQLA
jgi:hypothetical protein